MRTLERCKQILSQLKEDRLGALQSQADARYILYGVNETNMPQFDPQLDERMMLVVYMYLSLGLDFDRYEEYDYARKCFEQAGSLIEHIHRDKKHQNNISVYSLYIAALAFYCGGQYSKAFVIAKEIPDGLVVGRLLKSFLFKKFSQLESLIDEIVIEDDSEPIDVDFAKAWSYVLEYLRFGDVESFNCGIEKIDKIRAESMASGWPDFWWVCSLTVQMLNRLRETSLWSQIPKLGGDKSLTDAYIHYLFYSKNTIELFKTQIEALDVIARGNGAVVSLPTSSGKTRIAEMAILKSLMDYPDSAVLYLAPFRSLAYEVESDFETLFAVLGRNVSHLYGNNDFSIADREAMEESSVWIATPEKIKAIYRGGGFQKHVSMVIIDEGHLIDTNSRNMANEIFTEELRGYVEKEGGRFLVLSAVLPNAQDMAEWLTHSADNMEVSDWRVSSQRKGIIIGEKKRTHLLWTEDQSCFNRNFLTESLDWKATCAQVAKKFQSFGSVMIYVAKAAWVHAQALAVYDIVKDEPDLDWENDVDWMKFELICEEDDNGGDVLKFARKGILCHQAGLTDGMRITMERLLRKGKAKYVVATSTLAQGVNIGVSTVIFADVDFGHHDYISKRDFWNVAGRAGRAFVDTEGRILFYVNAASKDRLSTELDRAWGYMRDQKIDNVTSGVKTCLDEIWGHYLAMNLDGSVAGFLELLDNDCLDDLHSSVGFLFDNIDDTLLSIDLSLDSDDEMILNFLENTLSIRQTDNANKDTYKRILSHRVRYNRRFAGDDSSLFAGMGLALQDSVELYRHLQQIDECVNRYARSGRGFEDLLDLIDHLESYVLELPTDRIKKVRKTDLDANRRTWLTGETIVKKKVRKDVTMFYTLSMPWVMNAIAGYYRQQNKDLSQMLVDINLCLRIGVPTVWAGKVYGAGIESRKMAIEISEKMADRSNESRFCIQSEMLSLNPNEDFSEQARRWLEILRLDKDRQEQRTKRLNSMVTHFDGGESERLYIRKVKNDYVVRNMEYTEFFPIDVVTDVWKSIANNPGIYFVKRGDVYELVSDNSQFRIG